MNKEGRIYRTLKAAKNAFLDKSNTKPADTKQPPEPLRSFDHIKTNVMDLDPQYCIGCTACFSACPTDAISMVQDEMGFYCRSIDFDKCIHCGKCTRACPVINNKHENSHNPDCFAVMADDEIRQDSSSGGAFTLAASYVLSQGGYVCGAVLNDDFVVEHTIIYDEKELYRMRGSKYVQSKLGNTFREIKKLLDDNKYVMFSGTPCQAGGLKNYLSKDYDNLIIVDILCHGAPSIKVYQKYLDEYYGLQNLKGFKFRTKEFGYNSFNQTAYLKDGSKVSGNIKFDAYEKTMHSGLALKDICGDCMFASAPRQGDISIGDFWGISKYNADYNDNLGTSCLLVNNKKGEAFFEKIKENTKLCKSVPLDVPIRNNRLGRKMRIPTGRRWFYNMLDTQPIDKAVDYALNRKFDVGVIGLWYGRNYGSMATYYALHYVLTHMGLSVLMIENCLKPSTEDQTSKTHPRRIANEFYDVSLQYSIEDLVKLNVHCDSFIVGSDQLWNIWLSRPYRQTYFLGFVDDNKKKIAYGTSFGIPYCGSSEDLLVSRHNLQRFDHISVRDKLSEDTCRDLFGVDATQVCDPTFLCPMEGYEELTKRAKLEKTENYILAYILDPNDNIGRELERISVERGCKIKVLLDELPKVRQDNIEKLSLSGNGNVELTSNVDLFEWLWYYKNADSVITDSFHGTIFSIIYKKPFISLVNPRRGAERFISLLTPLGLEDRLLNDYSDIASAESRLSELDYTEPYKKLNNIRENSYNWLKNALFSTKKFKSSGIYKVIDERMEEE